jgi:hypothetical protein
MAIATVTLKQLITTDLFFQGFWLRVPFIWLLQVFKLSSIFLFQAWDSNCYKAAYRTAEHHLCSTNFNGDILRWCGLCLLPYKI